MDNDFDLNIIASDYNIPITPENYLKIFKKLVNKLIVGAIVDFMGHLVDSNNDIIKLSDRLLFFAFIRNLDLSDMDIKWYEIWDKI